MVIGINLNVGKSNMADYHLNMLIVGRNDIIHTNVLDHQMSQLFELPSSHQINFAPHKCIYYIPVYHIDYLHVKTQLVRLWDQLIFHLQIKSKKT